MQRTSGQTRNAMMVMSLAMAAAAPVRAADLDPALASIGFLVGDWASGEGKVAQTGGTSRGRSLVTAEVDGGALLRRDHVDLYDAAGKPAGGFDQLMIIYAEDGGVHAEYSDGRHVIHYIRAEVTPGRSVTFTSAPRSDAPVYRLSYELKSSDALAVAFAVEPPGASAFRPIATGELHKRP